MTGQGSQPANRGASIQGHVLRSETLLQRTVPTERVRDGGLAVSSALDTQGNSWWRGTLADPHPLQADRVQVRPPFPLRRVAGGQLWVTPPGGTKTL